MSEGKWITKYLLYCRRATSTKQVAAGSECSRNRNQYINHHHRPTTIHTTTTQPTTTTTPTTPPPDPIYPIPRTTNPQRRSIEGRVIGWSKGWGEEDWE
jgi:hypothetical protein